jgi:hypothetical protein
MNTMSPGTKPARLPSLSEVALAASALAELRHGKRAVGRVTLKELLRRS